MIVQDVNVVPTLNAAYTKANTAEIIAIAAFTQANTGGGGSSVTTAIVTGTTQSALKDYRYILANTSATTVTLPTTPTLGDSLYIVISNGLANNVIGRNSSNIMGLSEDMIIDIANSSIGLVYVNATLGWRII